MTERFPRSFGNLSQWASTNDMPVGESRVRFAQYAVLCAIASVRSLRASFVFKGGNALDFVWLPNRSTIDLDFSFDAGGYLPEIDEATIRSLLQQGLDYVSAREGIIFAVHRVQQQPPGEFRTFVTYVAKIGYALPDQMQLRLRMTHGQVSPQNIPVEISVAEPICGHTETQLDESYDKLRVATIEDIVAEKLRALLQQPIRNRQRRQDLLDIAMAVRQFPEMNRWLVAEFLAIKAKARNVPVSKADFHNPDIARRAQQDYAELAATTRVRFVPFDEAWAVLMGLIDELPIAE